MGNSSSHVTCNNCNIKYGDVPVFFLYNDEKYQGNYLCSICYLNKDKEYYNLPIKDNKFLKILCNNCKECSVNNKNTKYVKIYWNGKHNKKTFCEFCLIKSNRNKNKK